MNVERYAQAVRLLRDIQERLEKESRAATEENDLTGPWLPVGFCVRIDEFLEGEPDESPVRPGPAGGAPRDTV